MRNFRHATIALCTAAACAFAPMSLPTAQTQPLSSGSSRIDSNTPLVAVPIVILGALMGGLFGEILYGRWMFGGSSRAGEHLGSSYVVDETFPDPDAPPAELRSLTHVQDNVWELVVYSPSMDKEIANDVILPAGGPENTQPRPAFYLLAGSGGGESVRWWSDGDAAEFFKDKLINVVTPRGSRGNLQADWAEPDKALGTNKWTTYLTKELPPLIDELFHGTGNDAIGGLSLSGGPALHMATLEDRFKVAGTYSSCPSTTGVVGQVAASSAVTFNKARPSNMWGQPWDPAWEAHSPVLHLEDFADIPLFITASRGIPSEHDVKVEDSPDFLLIPDEQYAYTCSQYFVAEAQHAGLDVDWYEFEEGTHNFGLFRRELVASWATIGPALGVE